MYTTKFNGLSIFQGKDFTKDQLLEYALSFSNEKSNDLKDKILHWDFGPIMEMKYDINAQNYLFSDELVPFHWDGAFHRVPRLLLFYCLETEGKGGETLFTNTELLWKSLTLEEQNLCLKIQLTYQTEKKAHYGGEICLPLVQKHPLTGNIILRMAEEVRTKLNPVTMLAQAEGENSDKVDTLIKKILSKLYSEEFLITHSWNAGDLILVDNYTFLHGRNKLGNNRSRKFYRIQIL